MGLLNTNPITIKTTSSKICQLRKHIILIQKKIKFKISHSIIRNTPVRFNNKKMASVILMAYLYLFKLRLKRS